jgi:hypothetical protein
MSDASDAVEDLNRSLQTTDSLLSSISNKAKSIGGNLRGGGAGGGGGGQVANFSSSTTGGAGSASGGSGGSSGLDVGGLPDFKDPVTRASRMKMLGGGALELAGGVSAFLPSTQEAMNIDTLANRLRFYGNSAAQQNIGGTFAMQRGLAALGTPINAMDPAIAANSGAGMGLLPGLSNYNATSQFGGVLGGAALASNLTPGLGLQGGMAAMAGLNTARNVNMLRMIGVNVRNGQGQMNDLPDIISQIFRLLEQAAGAGNVTPQSIAVSAMSGNALDSILNQYFGNDSALRQTVLSGLLQMASTGGTSLRVSGVKDAMVKTGGLSAPVTSLASRNADEQNMLQQWASATNTGFMGANSLLGSIYKGLGNAASGTNNLSQGLQGIQAGIVGMETFGGARGGAGAMVTDAILGTANGMLGNSLGGQLARLGGVGAALTGAFAAGNGGFGVGTGGQGINPNVSPGGSSWTAPTTPSSPVYTGNITINVTAPTGSDPWAFANQVTQAMVNTARS